MKMTWAPSLRNSKSAPISVNAGVSDEAAKTRSGAGLGLELSPGEPVAAGKHAVIARRTPHAAIRRGDLIRPGSPPSRSLP